jgi:REP element-mobilizing transposase RayT
MAKQTDLTFRPSGQANQPVKPVRSDPAPLQAGVIYHIYNRGVNRETIFHEKRNYAYFINLYVRHIQPMADTYAFCLLPNHFHLLIEVKQNRDLTGLTNPSGLKSPSQAFSNLFNAYAKAINIAYQRTGPLFERPFKRIPMTDSQYFMRLLIYIHQNPQRHGLIDDFRDWPYSSYGVLTGNQPTFVKRDVVREWFGDVKELIDKENQDLTGFENLSGVEYLSGLEGEE